MNFNMCVLTHEAWPVLLTFTLPTELHVTHTCRVPAVLSFQDMCLFHAFHTVMLLRSFQSLEIGGKNLKYDFFQIMRKTAILGKTCRNENKPLKLT